MDKHAHISRGQKKKGKTHLAPGDEQKPTKQTQNPQLLFPVLVPE